MHRIDVGRAVGRPLVMTPEHDGVLVAEWADRHGRPRTLTLSGRAGGSWNFGKLPGPHLALDAVEFCRTLSERCGAEVWLATAVPFFRSSITRISKATTPFT